MNRGWKVFARVGGVALCFVAGVGVGRMESGGSSVHAEDRSYAAGCRIVVPKAWGEYKGASAYGLAFQDETGTLRFMLHPPCGNLDSSTDASAIDLLLERK